MEYPHPTISLRQLRYFVAVTDAGSFSAASERTHVAQPALSRQVAMLEAEVGARLMQRSRNGVALTESGLKLYGLARSMLERLGSVQSELISSEKQPAGVVTVALPPSLASMLVPAVVRELERRYPRIVLRVEDGVSLDSGRSLQSALIDFGIVPTAAELADIDCELLVRESLWLVQRCEGTRDAGQTVAFRQAAGLRLALPPNTFHTRRLIDEAARSANIALNVAYEQRSMMTIVSLVREGLAATITNFPAVEQYWRPGAVSARRIVKPQLGRVISLARPSGHELGPAAETVYGIFRRFAIEAVKEGRWRGKALC